MLCLLGLFITVTHFTNNIQSVSGGSFKDDPILSRFSLPSNSSSPWQEAFLNKDNGMFRAFMPQSPPQFQPGQDPQLQGQPQLQPPIQKYYPEEMAPVIMGKALITHGNQLYQISLPPQNGTLTSFPPLYKWTITATDDCMPQIYCDTFNLAPPSENGVCLDQFMEISDGIIGMKRFCGNVGPQRVVAYGDSGLRDIYITFNNSLPSYPAEFQCFVCCGEEGKTEELPQALVQRVDHNCVCGRKPSMDRIIGGLETNYGEFPWLAAMVVAKTRQPYCIGSVINDRMILTAAHCFKGRFRKAKNTQVILNGYIMDPMPNINVVKGPVRYMTYDQDTLYNLDLGNNSFRFDVDKIWIHPLYDPVTSDFDTALMILSKPIDSVAFTTYSPICLPELTYDLESFAGAKAVIAGWGLPDIDAQGTLTRMKKITVNVYKANDCAHFFGERFTSPKRMMCAAYPDSSQDSCAGDSGGPLLVEHQPSVWQQVGIISWGESCASPGNPGVYYRTTSTNQWIRHISNSKESIWCAAPTV